MLGHFALFVHSVKFISRPEKKVLFAQELTEVQVVAVNSHVLWAALDLHFKKFKYSIFVIASLNKKFTEDLFNNVWYS